MQVSPLWNRDPQLRRDRSRKLLGVRRSYSSQNTGMPAAFKPGNGFWIGYFTWEKFRICYFRFFWTPRYHAIKGKVSPDCKFFLFWSYLHGVRSSSSDIFQIWWWNAQKRAVLVKFLKYRPTHMGPPTQWDQKMFFLKFRNFQVYPYKWVPRSMFTPKHCIFGRFSIGSEKYQKMDT